MAPDRPFNLQQMKAAAPLMKDQYRAHIGFLDAQLKDGRPFVSDNGNHILDAKFQEIEASDLERRIDALPGVVDNGLFVGMADLVLFQSESSFHRLSRT